MAKTQFSTDRSGWVVDQITCEYTGEVSPVIVTEHSETYNREACGSVKTKRGYIVCKGKDYVGLYGNSSSVYTEDLGVFFKVATCFDGIWAFSPQKNIHANSGRGNLYTLLLNYAKEKELL